ncbi:sugar MFS transporter [Dysgonomonas sp. ZJ709]|uniref:MFS transporter n=1 Tax=Dysgonomonas sp. ZJ709 TaxID=2709797 RepID=UPI0013E9DBA2|nr:MFS transporter [Dysgonomonas sp. ZJ709]
MKRAKILIFLPVLLAFFAMGFVDSVGIATNYVKEDFQLTDTVANLLPSMVFLWFLIFSIPVSMLMNKIGRRKTVILSLFVTFIAMLPPLVKYNLAIILISFALLGIGNTLMQVSLNPLLTDIVSSRKLASSMTFGVFFKTIAAFLAPIIAAWTVLMFGDWKMLFTIFGVVSLIPLIWLIFTPIKETLIESKTFTFIECFKLLRDKAVLLLFIGILIHVGIDIGINLTAPKILMERLDMELTDAGYATSLYFLFRIAGSFLGAFLLTKVSLKRMFILSISLMALGVLSLFIFNTLIPLYVGIALFGLGNANIFAIIFSNAMQLYPTRKNEVSGLMVMGISGAAIFPVLMGLVSDALGSQVGAVIIIAGCIGYLAFLSLKIR